MRTRRHVLLSSVLVMTAGLLTHTTVLADQRQLAASIREAREEASRTHEQLASTLSSLNALTKQTKGDLRPAYTGFAAEVPKTEAAASWTRTRVNWMNGDGAKYFDGWAKDLNGIANESLRKKAQKRLDGVKKSYDRVAVALTKASDKFQPFLSDLKDIQKMLANDVTPGGVKAIRSTVSSANWNYKYVDSAINDGLKEMQKMEKALSTETN